MDNNYEIELEIDNPDYTLLGYRIEQWIEACIPNWIINFIQKNGNKCGCNKRREWFNNKHLDWRDRKLDKATSNYYIALDKLNKLKIRYGYMD